MLAVFLSSLVGCASRPVTPSRQPEPANEFAREEEDERRADTAEQSVVRISDDIRKACQLSESEAYFAYNSANVRAEHVDLFEKLAACFARGPLIGRTMRIVGHADPRGDDEYNLVLGSRRADGVQKALVEKGLTAERITTTSRGEMDAKGSDEAGWATDRRIDLMLADSDQ
jgi:peptidoglycan-associated lipoprotein